MTKTEPYKAIAAFVLTFLGALSASLQGRKDTLGNMTAVEWLFVVVAALVVAGGTYIVPNPPVGRRRGEAGQSWPMVAVGLAAAAIFVYVLVLLVR